MVATTNTARATEAPMPAHERLAMSFAAASAARPAGSWACRRAPSDARVNKRDLRCLIGVTDLSYPHAAPGAWVHDLAAQDDEAEHRSPRTACRIDRFIHAKWRRF